MGLDLRFGLRQLRRNPAFTVAAALTPALGVAATTTVFGFVDAVLHRPLPYPEPSRLFVLWNARAGALAASRAMRGFLYDVPPTDPMSVAAACGIVAFLVVAAALAPARRAADTDSMNTLRSE